MGFRVRLYLDVHVQRLNQSNLQHFFSCKSSASAGSVDSSFYSVLQVEYLTQ